MKRNIFSVLFAISLPSAVYVMLMSTDGFDSAYWVGVTIYSLIWFAIVGLPTMLILKKFKKLTVIYLSTLGASCAALSILLPHLKDLYLAKMSNLTLQEGQHVMFSDGIITEYALNQFYTSLMFALLCGLMGGVIFSMSRKIGSSKAGSA